MTRYRPSLLLLCALPCMAAALDPLPRPASAMTTQHATGLFEVKMNPLALEDKHAPGGFGRFALDKKYQGPLKASGMGEMLAARTQQDGSAGYVAIEHVVGTLEGRKGSFVLQHNGVMTRGAKLLSITVVPDSGTEELTGLSGQMDIRIEDGKHFYDFDYRLP